jgi:hypothetical protein
MVQFDQDIIKLIKAGNIAQIKKKWTNIKLIKIHYLINIH